MNAKSTTARPSQRQKQAPMKNGKKKPIATNRALEGLRDVLEIKSILVPTDFSPASEKALAYAAPLARLCGAKLTLLHVVEPIATPDFLSAFPLAMEDDEVKKECRQHLQSVVEALELEPGLIDRLVVRNGRTFVEIAAAARSLKVDLIIISTHGRTGLKHALLGSTAERVVQHASCPVLVVRPKERELLKSSRR
jgi:universal stress protein A